MTILVPVTSPRLPHAITPPRPSLRDLGELALEMRWWIVTALAVVNAIVGALLILSGDGLRATPTIAIVSLLVTVGNVRPPHELSPRSCCLRPERCR